MQAKGNEVEIRAVANNIARIPRVVTHQYQTVCDHSVNKHRLMQRRHRCHCVQRDTMRYRPSEIVATPPALATSQFQNIQSFREPVMFINGFISPEDVEKYHLAEIDETFVAGGTHSRQWTIDCERDICIRNVVRGREDT